MDTITPVRERPIPQSVGKWLESIEVTSITREPSPTFHSTASASAIPSRFSGTTLVNPSTRRLDTLVDLSTPATTTTPQPPATKRAKRDTIRTIFRSWRHTLSRRNADVELFSTAIRENPESAIADLAAHLCGNFAVLIEEAIRNSPSLTQSTVGICKDIMRRNEWYHIHEKYGWQEIVARELTLNPLFQPVIECRKGKIRRNKSVKWQLTGTAISTNNYPQVCSWRSPQDAAPYPVELSGNSATHCTQKTTEIPEESLTSSDTSPSPDAPPPRPVSPPNRLPSILRIAEPSCSGIKRWSLHDQPMVTGLLNTTCNNGPAPERQTTGNPVRPDRSDDAGKAPSSGRNGGFEPNEHKRPGGASDGNGDRKRKRLSSPDKNKNRRRFACVYHKYDPDMYGVQNRRYLICAGGGWEYFSELTRHLERKHGEYVCGKCLRHYDNAQECDVHMDQCTVRLRCSQEERWAGLWRARFPGVPVPDDPYVSTSAWPPHPSLHTQPESVSNQADNDPSPSSLSSPFPGTTPDTPNTNSSPVQSLNSNNEQANNQPLPVSATIQVMECRIECLEKRLPWVEDTLRLALRRLLESPPEPSSETSIPASALAAMAKATSLGSSIYSTCAPYNNNMLSVGANPSISRKAGTAETASNCPPFGSSTSISSGPPSQPPPSEELLPNTFNGSFIPEGGNNPFLNNKTGAGDGDGDTEVIDYLTANLEFEAWNDEHEPVSGSVPSFMFETC
ncbi:hypothetical protein BDW59DRAFT_72825 [Aspergillus cavernicola]|uniref:Fork-head domain-containing protein n=1 Tax=Aspergillus cavernicola TaxID=176166 RepID=A0ABR4IDV0_9EURO